MRHSPVFLRVCWMLAVITVCATTAYIRLAIWQDDITLWTNVVQNAGQSSRGFANLGGAYLKKDRVDAAVDMFRRSLAIAPNSVAYNGLGNAYAARHLPFEAIGQYSLAIAQEPLNAEHYYNRGIAEFDLGWYAQAAADYTAAIRLDKRHGKAYMNRGNAYDELGRINEALQDYASAVEIDPDYAEVFFNRGLVLKKIGRRENAHNDFTFACSRGMVAACGELAKETETSIHP